ncbi:MAG: phosphoribosylanthranilate isomerase [Acidimicrobiia bacterium]|nr:phosphoribosylanthranilate isomerase [Acidimicrobiia bacterium]
MHDEAEVERHLLAGHGHRRRQPAAIWSPSRSIATMLPTWRRRSPTRSSGSPSRGSGDPTTPPRSPTPGTTLPPVGESLVTSDAPARGGRRPARRARPAVTTADGWHEAKPDRGRVGGPVASIPCSVKISWRHERGRRLGRRSPWVPTPSASCSRPSVTASCAPAVAADIAKRLPPEVLTVGVFRDEAPQRVVEIVNSSGLRGAQLHGHESADDATYVKQRVPFLIQAFPAWAAVLDRVDEYPADAFLLDSASPGSGEVFDWSLAEGAPDGQRGHSSLEGSRRRTSATAIQRTKVWGVDVATGVESEPGRKDARKVMAFVENARAAAPTEYEGDDELPYDWVEDE